MSICGCVTTACQSSVIDVAPVTAAFAASLLRNEQVRVVAFAAPQRLGGVLADVPTWREQGYDAVVSNWRAFLGPRGLAPARLAYWEQAFRRLNESDEWKKELADNLWIADYQPGAALRAQLDRDDAQQRAFLKELALAK